MICCKLSKLLSYRSKVLILQFNHERRDRRKREYVLTEEGDHQQLLDLLMPIVETNQATLLVGNRVEVSLLLVQE